MVRGSSSTGEIQADRLGSMTSRSSRQALARGRAARMWPRTLALISFSLHAHGAWTMTRDERGGEGRRRSCAQRARADRVRLRRVHESAWGFATKSPRPIDRGPLHPARSFMPTASLPSSWPSSAWLPPARPAARRSRPTPRERPASARSADRRMPLPMPTKPRADPPTLKRSRLRPTVPSATPGIPSPLLPA